MAPQTTFRSSPNPHHPSGAPWHESRLSSTPAVGNCSSSPSTDQFRDRKKQRKHGKSKHLQTDDIPARRPDRNIPKLPLPPSSTRTRRVAATCRQHAHLTFEIRGTLCTAVEAPPTCRKSAVCGISRPRPLCRTVVNKSLHSPAVDIEQKETTICKKSPCYLISSPSRDGRTRPFPAKPSFKGGG